MQVESAPSWIQKPESQDAVEKETAIIHCSASGDPESTINWFINGIPISEVPENPRRIVEKNSITYFNVTKEDTCAIQCNATNKHGYIFANVYLNVRGEYFCPSETLFILSSVGR